MRRFFLMVLVCCFLQATLSEKAHAEGKGKLLGGIILTVLGIGLAADGFSQVVDKEWDEKVIDREWNEDISNPELTITENVWSKELILTWWAHHWWEVKNTGNVEITDCDITVSYYDSGGFLIDYWTFDRSLSVGNSTGWDDWLTNCGATEPDSAYLTPVINSYIPVYEHHITYKYEPRKEYATIHHKTMKQKNPTLGYIGIAGGCYGLYLIIDYVKESSRVSKFLGKHYLDIKLVKKYNSINLFMTKKFRL